VLPQKGSCQQPGTRGRLTPCLPAQEEGGSEDSGAPRKKRKRRRRQLELDEEDFALVEEAMGAKVGTNHQGSFAAPLQDQQRLQPP